MYLAGLFIIHECYACRLFLLTFSARYVKNDSKIQNLYCSLKIINAQLINAKPRTVELDGGSFSSAPYEACRVCSNCCYTLMSLYWLLHIFL